MLGLLLIVAGLAVLYCNWSDFFWLTGSTSPETSPTVGTAAIPTTSPLQSMSSDQLSLLTQSGVSKQK
jgi:hypothetical protein